MRRGEVWWSTLDTEWPIVLLTGDGGSHGDEFEAMHIVAPATEAQKQGFIVLSAAEAADRPSAERNTGVEVFLGTAEGLARPGVVRVALPQEDRIFCTWQLTVARDALVEQAGMLGAEKMTELATALRLAGIER